MIARIRVGDEGAFGAVYDQYAALVHGIAARLVGREAAADVTQEVFVHLWTRPDGFDPERGGLRTYLAVMARRRAIDLLRWRGRAAEKEQVVARQAPTAVPDIDEAALAMMAAERVREAVGRLPDDQRVAVNLAYFEGLTFREVAVRTGVPEGTAKSRLRLALARLEAALHDEGSRSWA
jgi:RNA polymerase sigma-70 factor (ECF subfamily)